MLTGKTKQDFDKWLFYERFNQQQITFSFFEKLDSNLQNTLIIEWFDKIGMYFWVYRSESGYWANSIEKKAKFDDRNEALIDGIEIINVIYND